MSRNVLPEQPDWLIGLSLQLGEDLTPHQDLEYRLDATAIIARTCQEELREFAQRIRNYELTIAGHVPVAQEFLDRLTEAKIQRMEEP